ncbi:hypothetical protein C1T17_05460 [Sphingobium sp. SCG-1]|uniref:hypothetical protein n=1 Tax=Sphingobium sp. SCG-1 TaxID=2072936 RepID=UPI000CD67D98|nr:hypothetical protein [Sphingobium sp. SCG-1]AUW57630.1 hypothetical protein C1T17_05460 [Sphingobium sp. SCG-1]
MIEFAALTYGVLASFVLSSAGRNHAARKPHPPVLRHIGYVLCGMSAGTCAILTGAAAMHFMH